MYRKLAVLSVFALGLSGCFAEGQDDQGLFAEEPVPIVEADQESQLAALPPVPARRPSDMSGFIPPEDAHLASKRIDDLVGLSPIEIEDLLGGPALEEVQPPAKIWSYNGQECVLSIFFYPRVGGEDYRALAYEVKGAKQESPEQATQEAEAAAGQAAAESGAQAAATPEDNGRCFTTLLAQNASSRRAAEEAPAAVSTPDATDDAPVSQPVE